MSTKWRKIQANMCFDVVFLYENMGTCLFTPVFLHLVLTFTPHYIIMVKGLLVHMRICALSMCNIEHNSQNCQANNLNYRIVKIFEHNRRRCKPTSR